MADEGELHGQDGLLQSLVELRGDLRRIRWLAIIACINAAVILGFVGAILFRDPL